jgi:hypothetical protein
MGLGDLHPSHFDNCAGYGANRSKVTRIGGSIGDLGFQGPLVQYIRNREPCCCCQARMHVCCVSLYVRVCLSSSTPQRQSRGEGEKIFTVNLCCCIHHRAWLYFSRGNYSCLVRWRSSLWNKYVITSPNPTLLEPIAIPMHRTGHRTSHRRPLTVD